MHVRPQTLVLKLAFILVPAMVYAQGPASYVGWYNGDPAKAFLARPNWYVSDQQFSRTYDNFVVPQGGWTIAGLFSVNNMSVSGITEAIWEIRGGVSAGNGGTVIASGRNRATQQLLYTLPDGENVYRIEVDALSTLLAPGTYWLNVTPVLAQWSPDPVGAPSYVEATTGTNAAGNPPGNDGNAFYYSNAPPQSFFQPARATGAQGTSGDFSQGVLISGGLGAAPSIAAVVSAASWRSGAISPGELIVIAGSALGPVAPAFLTLDQSGKVSTSLNGIQVLIGGVAAPLTYADSNQINAVVPYEVAGAANPILQVKAGQTSAAFPLTLAQAVPALFTANGSGTGPAAALNQDASYNSPGNPAERGSYVVLFMTGEGLTTSPITGAIITTSPVLPLTPQPLLSPVSVSVGGQPAVVGFYGEAPGLVAGVMQLNVRIPATVPAGDLPVSIVLGAASTQNGVTISVRE